MTFRTISCCVALVAAMSSVASGQIFTGITWNASASCPGDIEPWNSGPSPVGGFADARTAAGSDGSTSGLATVSLRASSGPMNATNRIVMDVRADASRGPGSQGVNASAAANASITLHASAVSPVTYARVSYAFNGDTGAPGNFSYCYRVNSPSNSCNPQAVRSFDMVWSGLDTPRPGGATPMGVSVNVSLFGGTVPPYVPPSGGSLHGRFIVRFSTTGAPCLADVTAVGGGVEGGDGLVTVDDVVYFLAQFFSGNADVADVAGLGSAEVPDDQITVDDLVVFLAAFFRGYN